MIEQIAAALLALGVSFLDKSLDAQIDRIKDKDVKATAQRIEDEVIRILSGALGKSLAKTIANAIAVRTLDRWFENREDTRTWG